MKSNLEAYKSTEFSWAFKEGLNSAEEKILKSLDRSKSVLDAGTGGGRFLHVLKSEGFNLLTGFDYLDDFIKVAKSRDLSGSIRFDVANAEKLPYEDGQFDQCLYLAQVLCFIEERSARIRALCELKRVLKRNGIAYISFLFKESREKTLLGFLFTKYLWLFRKVFHREISLSLQPWLRHGGKFNWGSFIDAPPYVYWYSLEEAMEDVNESGLIVNGVATSHHLSEGRWLTQHEFRNDKNYKGILFIKCIKNQ